MTIEQWLGADNEIGARIWHKKYQHKDETFDQWLDRVSGGRPELRELIESKKFLFGGRTLANRGLHTAGSYFNCYSRGFIQDDYKDIMQAMVDIGLTFKGQGGQGISLSKLRPKGSPIKDEYQSDGIVPFMKMYNEVTVGTSQGGSRKGALMLSLDALHKEADTFIGIKSEQGIIEGANLSLEIDDSFMKAVEAYYDRDETVTLHISKDYSGHHVEYDVTPIDVFKHLVQNSYDWGDPACLFVDRFRNYNLMQYDGGYQIETCNPCGEQPLPKHGACCLGSLNLSEFIKNPYTNHAYFDSEGFVAAVHEGIRALDKMIDENYMRHPLPEQQKMSYSYRNIGLGIFGYATALMKMELKYGSESAVRFTDDVFALMFRAAVIASNNLAREFGPFPNYKDCVFDSDIMRKHFSSHEIEEMRQYGLRNCSLLSIAPTGSIATFLGESGGCEPEYAIKYTRRTVGMSGGEDEYYEIYCKAAKEYMKQYNVTELPEYFVSSHDIPYLNRIKTQAAMQEHVDTAISSTVNLPNNATTDDVAKLYLEAWRAGLKGITIFRDGCKKTGILTTSQDHEEATKSEDGVKHKVIIQRGMIMDVPDDLTYRKYKLSTGCGKLYLFVGIDDTTGTIYDFFTNTDGVGGCTVNTQAVSRLLSACVRGGVPIEYAIEQLQKAGTCPSFQYARGKGKKLSAGKSCASAIANVLSDLLKELATENGEGMREPELQAIKNGTKHTDEPVNKCPVCGAELVAEGGCNICKACGYDKCDQ